jgi:ketosteroid isomerase-like protein
VIPASTSISNVTGSAASRRRAARARAATAIVSLAAALGPLALPAQAPAAPAGPEGAAGAAPSGASAAQEVRGVFNLLVAAANRLDAGAEGAFFWRSPELISVAQGTPTFGWEDRDAHTRQWYGALESQRIVPDRVEVRELAPDVASLTTTFHQRIRAKDGRSWEGEGVWSLVFRRVKGDWRIVVEHYSYEK